MSDLFISYASPDRDIVRALVQEFETQGWTVWWDRHIEVGLNYDDRIENAIDEARCIVVVWSESSIHSDWVRAEAAEGLKRNILVPILLDDVKPPLLFRQKQALSLIEWKRAGSRASPLADLLPSISSILESYKGSSLPISTQRSWVLGQTLCPPHLEDLGHAAYTALGLALTYFEGLFVYSSEFRGRATHSLSEEQLNALVEEEGLDGFIAGDIAQEEDGMVFSLTIYQPGKVPIRRSTPVSDPSRVPLAVAECALLCAETLQGTRPREADLLIDFMQDRNAESLHHIWRSYRFADDYDYSSVRDECLKSLTFDDALHLAYEALATSYQYLGQFDESRKAMMKATRLTGKESQRNTFRTRGMYYALYSEDYEKAAQEFESLMEISPLDASAINNLAVTSFYQLRFDRARELSARDLTLYPKKTIGLQNAAFYALYAGAFEEADALARAVLAEDPNYVNSTVIRALVLAQSNREADADALYLSAMGENDRRDSVLLQGRADLAMAREDWSTAEELLTHGFSLDQALENKEHAARKQLMRAEVALSTNRPTTEAYELIADAIGRSSTSATLAEASLLCIRFDIEPPNEIESHLKRKVSSHGRAYAKMVSGHNALRSGDFGTATEYLNEATGICDLWIVRFARIHLFQRAELHLEAGDEISHCLKRSGEAISATLDEQPSYRYLTRVRNFDSQS